MSEKRVMMEIPLQEMDVMLSASSSSAATALINREKIAMILIQAKLISAQIHALPHGAAMVLYRIQTDSRDTTKPATMGTRCPATDAVLSARSKEHYAAMELWMPERSAMMETHKMEMDAAQLA